MSAADVFAALGAIPALPGARCRNRSQLFDLRPDDDPTRPDAEATALALCSRCPSLDRCRHWFDSLPPKQRPLGVIAGQVNLPAPVGRPRMVAS